MKHILLMTYAALSVTELAGQTTGTLIGARATGLAYTVSCLKDPWALFNNPGGLAGVASAKVSTTLEITPTLPGANRMAAAYVQPSGIGVFGLGICSFGDILYSEQTLSAAFSNKLGLASLGVRFDYIRYSAEGFGSRGTVMVGFGGIAELSPQIFVGAWINNLNQARMSGSEGERLPTLLSVGIGFRAADNLFIGSDLAKDLDYDVTWRSAIEYRLASKLLVRTGYSLNPRAASLGLGFIPGKLAIDYAFRYSTITLFSHQATLTYEVGKE